MITIEVRYLISLYYFRMYLTRSCVIFCLMYIYSIWYFNLNTQVTQDTGTLNENSITFLKYFQPLCCLDIDVGVL